MHKLSSDDGSQLRTGVAITSYRQCLEELVLNSVDSGSTCIAVRVNTVTGFLQVVDNGKGVDEKSMKTIGKRYSSSKDLPHRSTSQNLTSLGYRGEALASVISVSESVDIISRCSDVTLKKTFHQHHDVKIQVVSERPSTGTTIIVHKLFYSAPVRQYNINETSATQEISTLLHKLACIHYTITFSLRDDNDGKILLTTKPSTSVKAAVLCVFGPQYSLKLRSISGTCEQIQISGVISKVSYSRSRVKIITVNKRIISTKTLYKIVDKHMKQSLISLHGESGRNRDLNENRVVRSSHYLYVINLTMDTRRYDVTYEPSKRHVEFNDEEAVCDVLSKLVRRFLYTNNLHQGVCDETFNSVKSSLQHLTNQTLSAHDNLIEQCCDNSVDLLSTGDSELFANLNQLIPSCDKSTSKKQKGDQIPSTDRGISNLNNKPVESAPLRLKKIGKSHPEFLREQIKQRSKNHKGGRSSHEIRAANKLRKPAYRTSLSQKLAKRRFDLAFNSTEINQDIDVRLKPSDSHLKEPVELYLKRGFEKVSYWLLNQIPDYIEPLEKHQENRVKTDEQTQCNIEHNISLLVNHSQINDRFSQSRSKIQHYVETEIPNRLQKAPPTEKLCKFPMLQSNSSPLGESFDETNCMFEESSGKHPCVKEDNTCEDMLVYMQTNNSLLVTDSHDEYRTAATHTSAVSAMFHSPHTTSRQSSYMLNQSPITPFRSPFHRVREICEQYSRSVPVRSHVGGLKSLIQGSGAERSPPNRRRKYANYRYLVA